MGIFITKFSGPDGESLTFTPTEIIFRPGSILSAPPEIHPLASVRGVQLEDGEDLQERVTATRIVALGIFALAVKKKSGGDKWLAIEGDEYAWMIRVDRKHVNDAMRFVPKLRPGSCTPRALGVCRSTQTPCARPGRKHAPLQTSHGSSSTTSGIRA